ncbi:MAG: 3-phosphoserine/phosphohydroxythreonine transaminase [Clostridia bacterium]|nr:3-phosphoserine/phosphohydroxythreonine transaminase [Clostridia bacterium]
MDRVYNFSAGPGALPTEVLEKVRDNLLSYEGLGMSFMELERSSPEFSAIVHEAEDALRRLMNIPSNYKVLFMQGGATLQYSAVPMNLLSAQKRADYIITGQSSKHAYSEAKKYGDIAIAASSGGALPAFSAVPVTSRSDFRPDADYVHICFSDQVYGTKFHYIPDTGNIPLVADMSSCILSEPIDVTRFGVIYASAQQNIGPAGLTVVIVRGDLLGNARPDTPSLMNYKLMYESSSMYNTPPIFAIYTAKLVFERIAELGGLDEMKRRTEKKASLLYDFIDKQPYYTATADSRCRSMTNVVFTTGDGELDRRFIAEAKDRGLVNLAGDKTIGGMRASMYNSVSYQAVQKLVEFMNEFAMNNPKVQT